MTEDWKTFSIRKKSSVTRRKRLGNCYADGVKGDCEGIQVSKTPSKAIDIKENRGERKEKKNGRGRRQIVTGPWGR